MLCSDDMEDTDDCDKYWESCSCRTQVMSPLIISLWTMINMVYFYSGSMEPSYYRGDILFLVRREEIVPGDIVVYSIQNEAIPIVHRVTTVQRAPNKELRILTKGDNNPVDDRGLYPKGQLWLKEEQIMGQIVG